MLLACHGGFVQLRARSYTTSLIKCPFGTNRRTNLCVTTSLFTAVPGLKGSGWRIVKRGGRLVSY
jgi:hypothetical protein